MIVHNNEVLYRIKKALNLSEEDIVKIYALASYPIETVQIKNLLAKHQDKNFMLCSYELLGTFLDGLIAFKRGTLSHKKEDDSNVELTNNLILKKLRIALELKEAETEIIFSLAEVEFNKQQLSALFRKETHKNFKPCSDTLLISFLAGLDEFYFVGEEE